MSLNDLVSDFVARINNAVTAENEEVRVLKSNLIASLCKKLTTLDYFEGFEEQGNELVVRIKPNRINKLKRVSRPGQRVYSSHESFPKIIGGVGFNIITTSKGILTQVEANKEKAGGEILFQIY